MDDRKAVAGGLSLVVAIVAQLTLDLVPRVVRGAADVVVTVATGGAKIVKGTVEIGANALDGFGTKAVTPDTPRPAVLPTSGGAFARVSEEIVNAEKFGKLIKNPSEIIQLRVEERVVTLPLQRDLRLAPKRVAHKPRLLSLFPTNDRQFSGLYGRGPKGAEQRQMARMAQHYRAHDVSVALSFKELLEALPDADLSTPTVILAHSEENGRLIRFPNEKRPVGVDEIHTACLEARIECVVLTCHGKDVDLTTEISPEEAFKMWRTASAYAELNKNATITDLTRVMRFDLATRRAARRIVISSVVVSGGGLAVELRRRAEPFADFKFGSGRAVGWALPRDSKARVVPKTPRKANPR